MPGRRRFATDQRHALRIAIVEQVRGGATVKQICAGPGMPCQETVNGWMRLDPVFAAEMAAARGHAERRKRAIVPEDAGRAIVAGLAEGRPILDVLRAPGMPSYKVFMSWRREQAWFGEAVSGVMAAREDWRLGKVRARFRAYDAAIGERIYVRLWQGERLRAILRSDKAFPSLAVLARWRAEQPEFDAMLRFVMDAWRRKAKGPRKLTPELQDRIVTALAEGGSLRALARQPDMPCARTLYAWVARDAAFAAAVARACDDREDVLLEDIAEAIEALPPGLTARAMRARLAPLVMKEVRLRKRPG